MAHKPFDMTPPKPPPRQGSTRLKDLPEASRKEREAAAEKNDIFGSIVRTLGWMTPREQATHHIKEYSEFEYFEGKTKKKVTLTNHPAEEVILRMFEKREGPIMIHLHVWDYLTSKRQMMQASVFKHKLPFKTDVGGDLVFQAHKRADTPVSISVYEPDSNGWERHFTVFVANNKYRGAVRD